MVYEKDIVLDIYLYLGPFKPYIFYANPITCSKGNKIPTQFALSGNWEFCQCSNTQ
jgi:hypothetical protein